LLFYSPKVVNGIPDDQKKLSNKNELKHYEGSLKRKDKWTAQKTCTATQLIEAKLREHSGSSTMGLFDTIKKGSKSVRRSAMKAIFEQ
jgi:hypothetical protein